MMIVILIKLILSSIGAVASLWSCHQAIENRHLLQSVNRDGVRMTLITGDIVGEFMHLGVYTILIVASGLSLRYDHFLSHDDYALVGVTVLMIASTLNSLYTHRHAADLVRQGPL